MKAATGIGIVMAIVGCLLAALMEGTSPAAFFAIPAYIVIFIGTGGATLAAVGMERMKLIPALYKKVLSPDPLELPETVREMVALAEKARKDGLLALEGDIAGISDAFMAKGMQLVVDGTDPDVLKDILEAEMDSMHARHKSGMEVFKQAGGYGPTLGIIGTVMSLVHVLQNLSNPSILGPAISGAFIATLFGVGSANVVFLPVASRLKAMSEEEMEKRVMVLEGIMAIQAGDNPRVVSEKLMSFVPPAEREAAAGATAKGGAAAAAATA